MPITHAKVDNKADWTQADLDAAIAAGVYEAGTVLADIVLPSDWNDSHVVTGFREIPEDGRTYFVRTTGSDANDGLTELTAFETLTKAGDVVNTLDCSNSTGVSIDVGDGVFSSGQLRVTPASHIDTSEQVAIYASGMAGTTIDNLDVRGGGLVAVYGVTLTGSAQPTAEDGATVKLVDCTIGAGLVIKAKNRSRVILYSSVACDAGYVGGASLLIADEYSEITGVGFSFPSDVTFTEGCARAGKFSYIKLSAPIVPAGAFIGDGYSAETNSIIDGGGDATYYGGTGGTLATGGQYV